MPACKGCGAAILWAVTLDERAIPLDAEPNDAGNIAMTGRQSRTRRGMPGPECEVAGPVGLFPDGRKRYMPHHATCPEVEQFR